MYLASKSLKKIPKIPKNSKKGPKIADLFSLGFYDLHSSSRSVSKRLCASFPLSPFFLPSLIIRIIDGCHAKMVEINACAGPCTVSTSP
jgi:hypothetical protein